MESCLEVKIPNYRFLPYTGKTITWNLSESTKAFNSENIGQVCLVSSMTDRANKDQISNPVKDALSEFRVIVFGTGQ